jgi:group I intron endonuclease
MEQKNVIYAITNVVNGKKYVGSATLFHKRKKDHLNRLKNGKHHSNKLQNAYNKYGKENFIFSIIEIVDTTDVLIQAEQKWIDELKPEYNMTLIAGLNSHIGMKRSEETKKKISDGLKGKKLSEETKKKISDRLKGKKLTNKHKQNIKIGNQKSEKFKQALSNPDRLEKIKKTRLDNGGYVLSAEIKKQISETLKSKGLQSAISITIEKYSLDGELIEVYHSLTKAENANGLKRGRLGYNIIKNKKQIYKGFIWKIH